MFENNKLPDQETEPYQYPTSPFYMVFQSPVPFPVTTLLTSNSIVFPLQSLRKLLCDKLSDIINRQE